MAAASSSARAPRRSAGRGLRAPGGGVRWDRITRWALMGLVGVLLALYIGPVQSYFTTHSRANEQRARVSALKAEHARLVAERKSLQGTQQIQLRARAMGFVKPGERSFVVKGLPGGK